MFIVHTYNWSRRDFSYDARCEHCNSEQAYSGGYDDANYYDNVVPSITCKVCGESSNSKQADGPTIKMIPKYPINLVI